MRAEAFEAPRWNQLSELIAARTGLHFPPERRDDLRRAVGEAAPDFGFNNGDACADWLLTAPLSPIELGKLATHLTIGETYFFRERPSFNALAAHVLPVLIHRKRNGDRRLRLWSAASSTGEEAYSLAILIQQVLPDWRDWKVSILATDINTRFLRKAEEGVYGEWSFRESPPEFREQYFTTVGPRRYRVRSDVRDMVHFAELNLSQDRFPSLATDTNAMDLILCRNLLIYFTQAHAARLIGGLRHSLVDDGWLLVSPSECSQALFAGFSPVNFPGSIMYRKRNARAHVPPIEARPDILDSELPAVASIAMLTPLTESQVAQVLTLRPVSEPPDPLDTQLAAAHEHYQQGCYTDAVAMLHGLIDSSAEAGRDPRVLGLLARALANLGALDSALAASENWIAVGKLDPAAYYLNAMVLQELGERASSRAALHRAIYLLPEFTLAHFALGNCARAEARHEEAQRHFTNAARLLRGHASDEPVAESEGLTAGRLREIITALTIGGPDA